MTFVITILQLMNKIKNVYNTKHIVGKKTLEGLVSLFQATFCLKIWESLIHNLVQFKLLTDQE